MTENSQMEKLPLISVIVPVYKAEKYLRRCVDSILAQTYTNLELILVDDGSPDSCPAICDEYAQRDSRVRAVHQKNGGVSAARNAGIDIAKGKYISFVDSDDYVSEEYLEHLYRPFSDDSNVCMSAIRTVSCYKDGEVEDPPLVCKNDRLDETLLLVNPSMRLPSAWGKLYIRESIIQNGLYFDRNISFAEDTAFVVKYVSSIDGVSVHEAFSDYYYWRQDESTTNSDFSLHRLSLLKAMDAIRDTVPLEKPKNYVQVTKVSYATVFYSAMRGHREWKTERNNLRKTIQAEMKSGIHNPEMGWQTKGVAMLVAFRGYWIYEMYKKITYKNRRISNDPT